MLRQDPGAEDEVGLSRPDRLGADAGNARRRSRVGGQRRGAEGRSAEGHTG